MRVLEIITESQEIKESELNEGPLLNKIGSGVGKAVGTAAKGIGAVAGGIAGLGKAIKKGYQAGKSTVGGAGDDDDTVTTRSTGSGSSGTSTGTDAGTGTTSAAPSPKKSAPAAAPAARTAAPGTAKPQVSQPATGKVDLKTLKGAVATLPKNQRAQLRKIVAAKAGVA